jgi:hypothetical protein
MVSPRHALAIAIGAIMYAGAAGCIIAASSIKSDRYCFVAPARGMLKTTATSISRLRPKALQNLKRNYPLAVKMGAVADPLSIRNSSAKNMKVASWVAWWMQAILSVVSTVTLVFANAVKGSAQTSIISNGILLAAIGLSLSYINIIWTWTYRNLARSLPTSDEKGVKNLQKTVKVGVTIALVGMLITLIGAEQIVGTLVAKAVSGALISPQGIAAASAMNLQTLDIFVVQANTNTLLSHLASLINSLYLTTLKWPQLAPAPESP